MKMEQDIRPVTWLRNHTREMLDQVNETRRPLIVIRKGKPQAVIQDMRSYEDARNSLAILSRVLAGERDLREGKTIPQEKAFAEVRKRIRGHKAGAKGKAVIS